MEHDETIIRFHTTFKIYGETGILQVVVPRQSLIYILESIRKI